jgi:hypothetical protein
MSFLSGCSAGLKERKTLHFKFLAPWTEGRCVLARLRTSILRFRTSLLRARLEKPAARVGSASVGRETLGWRVGSRWGEPAPL